MTTTTPSDLYLSRLGEAITASGLGPVEAELAAVVARARQLGIRPVATDVLADPSAPAVVRERAFALVAMRLDALDATATAATLARVA